MWPVSHHHHHNGKANWINFTKTTSHPVLERIGRRDKEKHSWQEWKPQKDPLSFLPSKQINSYHVYMSARKWACSTISCNAEQRINLDHPLQFVFKTRAHFYLSITSITNSELKLQETTVLKVPVYLTVSYTGSYLVFHVYHNTNTTLKQKMWFILILQLNVIPLPI